MLLHQGEYDKRRSQYAAVPGNDSKELLLYQNGCIKQQDIVAPRQVSAGAHGVHSALPHIVTEDIDPS